MSVFTHHRPAQREAIEYWSRSKESEKDNLCKSVLTEGEIRPNESMSMEGDEECDIPGNGRAIHRDVAQAIGAP